MDNFKAEMLGEVLQSPTSTAVIVVDMQRDFCSPDGALGRAGIDISRNAGIVQPIAQFVNELRSAGVLIIWIHQLQAPLMTSDATQRRIRRVTERLGLCAEGTAGVELVDGIGVRSDDFHIYKYRYSAFAGSNLDMLLRSQRIETVVVCGTAANACVDSTARDASQLDYNVVVCADLTGYTDARLANASMENLDRYFAVVCDAGDVLACVPKP